MATESEADIERLVRESCPPSVVLTVRDEAAVLPSYAEEGWRRWTPRGIDAVWRGRPNTGVPGALEPGSLVVRDHGRMVDPADYDVHPLFGSICVAEGRPGGRPVRLDYRYGLQRLDLVVADTSGALRYVPGEPALAAPRPPAAPRGFRALAHVALDAFAGADEATVWPVGASSEGPRPAESSLARDHLMIAFLGDSVTQGAESTVDAASYPFVAIERLRARFPGTTVDARVVAEGGSDSGCWLGDDARCDWRRVEETGADVVVVEFVNDCHLDAEAWPSNYDGMLARVTAAGSRLVVTTPPYTARSRMDDAGGLGVDRRAYVAFLRRWAASRGVPLLDVASGWADLRRRGLPYWTLLANGLNHPDDRGHALAGRIVGDGLGDLLLSGEI